MRYETLRFASAWSNHAANSAGINPTRYIVGNIKIWATSNVVGLPASQLAICSMTQNATTKPSGGAMAAKIRKRVMVAISLGCQLLSRTVTSRLSYRYDASPAGRCQGSALWSHARHWGICDDESWPVAADPLLSDRPGRGRALPSCAIKG